MDWFTEIVEYHGIREFPVTNSIAILSVQLLPLHNDPCDRIIIATAEMNALGIITCDGLISPYEQAGVIW
jgi:PIN domain nuclease of toxin-antitoxin system